MDEAINETVIGLNVKIIKFNRANSCDSDYDSAKDLCNRDVNLYGTYALISCFSGPWTCALSTTLVMIENTNCMSDALEDFNDCSK